MNPQEFAQKIKAKYPQYKDVDDVELTNRIIAKYPVYASQVKFPEQKKTFAEKAMNTGTDVANFFGLKPVSEQYGATIAKARADSEEEKNLVENPTLKEVVGSAIQGVANFIPGAGTGAKLATKVAVGATTGLAFDVGADLQDGKTVGEAITPGVGTAIGAAVPFASALFGKVTEKTSKKIAQNLETANLRLSPKDKVFVEQQGPDFMNWLTSKKLTGNPAQRVQKIDTLYNQMEDKVQGVISKSSETIGKKDFIKLVNDIPEQLSDDPELYTEAQRIVGTLTKTAQEKFPSEIPLSLVNKLKRSYAKRAFDKAGQQVTNESRYRIAETLKESLNIRLPELQSLNDEYSKVILARKLINKALGRKQIGIVGKIASSIAGGGIGGAVGGPIGSAAGVLIGERVAENVAGTKARSNIGSIAQRLYEKVSKAPKDRKTFQISRKLLMNLINSQR